MSSADKYLLRTGNMHCCMIFEILRAAYYYLKNIKDICLLLWFCMNDIILEKELFWIRQVFLAYFFDIVFLFKLG